MVFVRIDVPNLKYAWMSRQWRTPNIKIAVRCTLMPPKLCPPCLHALHSRLRPRSCLKLPFAKVPRRVCLSHPCFCPALASALQVETDVATALKIGVGQVGLNRVLEILGSTGDANGSTFAFEIETQTPEQAQQVRLAFAPACHAVRHER